MMNLLVEILLSVLWIVILCSGFALFIIGVSFCWRLGQMLMGVLMVKRLEGMVRDMRERMESELRNIFSSCPSYDRDDLKKGGKQK